MEWLLMETSYALFFVASRFLSCEFRSVSEHSQISLLPSRRLYPFSGRLHRSMNFHESTLQTVLNLLWVRLRISMLPRKRNRRLQCHQLTVHWNPNWIRSSNHFPKSHTTHPRSRWGIRHKFCEVKDSCQEVDRFQCCHACPSRFELTNFGSTPVSEYPGEFKLSNSRNLLSSQS